MTTTIRLVLNIDSDRIKAVPIEDFVRTRIVDLVDARVPFTDVMDVEWEHPLNPNLLYVLPDGGDQENRRLALTEAAGLVKCCDGVPLANIGAETARVAAELLQLLSNGTHNPAAPTPAAIREALTPETPEPGPLTNVAERHQLAGLLSELDQLYTVLNTPSDSVSPGDVEFIRTHPLRVELEHDYTPPTTSEVVRAVTVWLNARLAEIPPVTRTTT